MNIPSILDVNRRAAQVFSRYLLGTGMSARSFCRWAGIPLRSFELWMADRNDNRGAIGHTARPPVKLIRTILARVHLPDHVVEALTDVVEYPERYMRKIHVSDGAISPM